jgi:serine/threonine protein kinase
MDDIKVNNVSDLNENVGNSYEDYSMILETYDLKYSDSDYYWQIGEIEQVQGWLLHLSVIRTQIEKLIRIIVPELAYAKVPFKIIKDGGLAKLILDGNLGYTQIGKIIAVYPKNDSEALLLSKRLIYLTESFRGPVIPTDRNLGSIVYCRYGSFNPMRKYGIDGKEVRCIYDFKHELIEDRYSIPFSLPEGITWPFEEIVSKEVVKSTKLLNRKYKPLVVIKNDAKGNVIKGIYFKGLLNIKNCIIKEGKRDMWADEQGRDMQERLAWQFELSNDLKNDIPLPQVLDFFQENEATYIVIEYIKGQPLEDIILSTYKDKTWFTLESASKLKLVVYLLRIIHIIDKLHKKGYIHRDITPNNFLITRRDEIYLIDMELAYSIKNNKPNPAFKLGTVGYISPEQRLQEIPTPFEDIYALGSLMIFIFTGLPPVKFDIKSKELKKNLNYFIRDDRISQLITVCLDRSPQSRPLVGDIIEEMERLKNALEESRISIDVGIKEEFVGKQNTLLNDLINGAIRGLSHPALLSSDNLWDSPVLKRDNYIGTEQMKREYLCGIHGGMSGIMYFLSKACELGYNIDNCGVGYARSWEYIQQKYLSDSSLANYGLYEGKAGIAIMIAAGMKAGLIKSDDVNLGHLSACFDNHTTSLTISGGLAGQGIALLQCDDWLPHNMVSTFLENYISIILKQQLPDGSWNVTHNSGTKNEKVLGFSYGVSGVIYFLSTYYTRHPDEQLVFAIRKALGWLSRQRKRSKDGYLWGTTTKNTAVNYVSFDIGIIGILFLYIKAYKHLKDDLFREIAEDTLLSIPSRITNVDFTHSLGISGLGEVYLEAYKVFKNEEWNKRATWIADLFQHTSLRHKDSSVYWSMNASPDPVSDLSMGAVGIIYFLMRYHNINYLNFPILLD